MDYEKIDFDSELNIGKETYNHTLGEWWHSRSSDRSHDYAYRRIADHIASLGEGLPKRIIDYCCGAGNILSRLYKRLPDAQLIGIDGSSLLLDRARRRMQRLDKDWAQRVSFIETELPDFSLPSGQADLVVLVFPNIVPDPTDDSRYDDNGYRHRKDSKVAKYLSKAREPDPEEETVSESPETLYDSLMTDKVISRNLRGLLKKGGICVRATYANASREEFTELVQQRLAFEEGCLDHRVNGRKAKQLFTLEDSAYFRSKIIEDVFLQTGDESDKEGGYQLTTLVGI